MNFFNPEQNSGGSPLYTRSYERELEQNTFRSGRINNVPAEPQPPTLLEPPVDYQPIFSQQSQPLHVNNFHQNALWLPAAEPQANIINNGDFQTYLPSELPVAGPQPAALFEFPLVGNQLILDQQGHPPYANNFYPYMLWPPVAELQGNIINAENTRAEPDGEVEPVDLQPHHLLPPVVPAIPNDAAHGAGSRPGQELRCGNRCRGVFAGPHKCIHHGRSLKISCRGDDGNCPSEFPKRNDFNRHCRSVHRGDRAEALVERLIDCPFADCDRVGEKGFKRKDNLTQHRRNVHEDKIVKNPIRFGRSNDAA